MKKVYTFYSDPGHGWLKVNRQQLIDLDIQDKISICSFQRGNFVYLEEDMDLSTFIDALVSRYPGIKEQLIFKGSTCANRQSRIRNYDRYSNNG